MTYEEGVRYMIQLCTERRGRGPCSFWVGKLLIEYPGYKAVGDYRLSIDGKAYTHEEMVWRLYHKTTGANAPSAMAALEDLFLRGLTSRYSFFGQDEKELIYWITLQEDINYPPDRGYQGRKLAYQRFYEAMLAKLGHIDIREVVRRTNNHFGPRPPLLRIEGVNHPIFYR
ncbi:hypothetical protein SAMN05421747_103224 [Parapedobacter composti]|uniref:Uncharacterized protein n=1 Tax=Parapedobacter composti TaxID=623281 RepID=A0A1I1FYM2_9SPHI|nr:hypothetical protein [Parapedobacter composti]SFC04136.1 hypothetical protein SAMN05421747_103224 [Parapedobacter composti]